MGSKYNKIAAPLLKLTDANGNLRDKIAAPYEVENALRAALAPPCVIAEWVNEARRRLRALSDLRRGVTPKKRIGYPVIRSFTLMRHSVGVSFRHFHLNPTRGWKYERITEHEAAAFKKKWRIPILKTWPTRGRYAEA